MTKRPPLTKEMILTKAIEIADQGGINALSMRKLATELDIQAMSLYYHFKTKDDLIANMADKLVVHIDFSSNDEESSPDWRSIMFTRAVSAMALFRKHAWLPVVIDTQIQSGTKRLEYIDNFIGTLRKAGFPIEMAMRVISLIDSYIYGYCKQLTDGSSSIASTKESAKYFALGFDAAKFPFVHEATALVMEKGNDENANFLFGLNVILKGIGLELEALV